MCVCVCVCVCVGVCVSVCVCEWRERERNGKKWCEFTVLSNMSPSMISVGYSGDLSIGGFYISFISTLFYFQKTFPSLTTANMLLTLL